MVAVSHGPRGLPARQEMFCRYVVRYNDRMVAYRKAGYKCVDRDLKKRAFELFHMPQIQTRIAELIKVADKALDKEVADIARELARVGFLDIRELFDEQGNLVPIKELPTDVARAIAGIDVAEDKTETTVKTEALGMRSTETTVVRNSHVKKIRLVPKLGALEVLAKWKKMLIDRREVGEPGEFDNKTTEELEAEVKAQQEALAVCERAQARVRKVAAKVDKAKIDDKAARPRD